MRITRHSVVSLLVVGLLLISNIYLFRVLPLKADGLTHIYFLDVGQGDSILIRTADSHTILIDGGPDDTVLSRLSEYLPPWHHSIDLMILTHPDSDHSTGLVSVLGHYPVASVWFNGVDHDTAIYHKFEQVIKDKQISTSIVTAGAQHAWAADNINVLYPFADTKLVGLDSNDTGVVTKFTDRNFDLLLTADISSKIEAQLVSRHLVTPVEFLKVPHHGSKTSSAAEFIEAAQPDEAVISVGAHNSYGHPTAEALTRYAQANVPVLRTDQHGTIQVITDGYNYKVTTAR